MPIRRSITMPPPKMIAALKKAGITQREVAERLGISPSAVSNLMSGSRGLKHSEAIKLLEMLEVAGWSDGTSSSSGGREVPLIGMAGAGRWVEAVELAKEHVWIPPRAEGKFALEVVGDSMNLLLPEGSIAIIDPDQTDLYAGKLYLLRNVEGEATIKRYRSDPARFEPVSDNASYVSFAVGSTDFRVLGRVTAGMQIF